jgi:DNA-binding NarL/FixJ family response regulator
MTISVLIADDHGVLRAGLRALLSAEPDMEVVGQTSNGDDALALAKRLQPDVLLADINMPGASGIELARNLLQAAPHVRVLILTMYEDADLLQQALVAGARGYIAKRVVETELIKGVRAVARGDVYVQASLSPQTAGGPSGSAASPAQAGLEQLSGPEKQFLTLMAHGRTFHEIAMMLGVDLQEVENLRASVGNKLGLHSRIEITRFARETGLS